MKTQVLIVGAGPTGLSLALGLAGTGIDVLIIDDKSGPGTQSRAMAMHARTLELYDQFGLANEMVDAGIVLRRIRLRTSDKHYHSHETAILELGDAGQDMTPFPFILCYPQDEHERALVKAVEARGIAIRWNTSLRDFVHAGDGVEAEIAAADGTIEKVVCSYICGCDGAHSQVRRSADIAFDGGTYSQRFFVADVKLDGDFQTDLIACLGEENLMLMLPVRSRGMERIIGLVPVALGDRAELSFEEVRDTAEHMLGVSVSEVNWFSSYRVHHRVAERFRSDRAFLLGDAGHVHSPVGAQGMNTGIGDAMNLSWKMAARLQGKADDRLLDTYEAERIGFARTLVASTDRAFTPMVASGVGGALTRRLLAPSLLRVASRLSGARRAIFRQLSQLHIEYRQSPLSVGRLGKLHAGDRLPWIGNDPDDNFRASTTRGWQIHTYGVVDDAFERMLNDAGWPVFGFQWDAKAAAAGLVENASYVIRPDGYIGFIQAQQDARAILDYFAGAGLSA